MPKTSALYTEFLETGSAQACAAFLEQNTTVEHIPNIKAKICTAGANWAKQFLAHNGLSSVLKVFSLYVPDCFSEA